jgi:hypothetical protein
MVLSFPSIEKETRLAFMSYLQCHREPIHLSLGADL